MRAGSRTLPPARIVPQQQQIPADDEDGISGDGRDGGNANAKHDIPHSFGR